MRGDQLISNKKEFALTIDLCDWELRWDAEIFISTVNGNYATAGNYIFAFPKPYFDIRTVQCGQG